jgi:molybdopterin-guanine dinucleotide biosynthesis adapter protein
MTSKSAMITHAPNGTPLIGIAGWKNSGKTTLVVRLVEEFTRRGLAVATIKHAHHSFDVDPGDTDSARHRRAGAQQVAVVSARRWALMTELDGTPEPPLAEILAKLAAADLIIVEGYKSEPIPKIEVRGPEPTSAPSLAAHDGTVIALATDHPAPSSNIPVFPRDAIARIADFIIAHGAQRTR